LKHGGTRRDSVSNSKFEFETVFFLNLKQFFCFRNWAVFDTPLNTWHSLTKNQNI